MSEDGQLLGAGQSTKAQGLGCAGALAAINLVSMGLLASTFAVGPYSSDAQEIWYRVGSVAFLGLGAILPAALLFKARRYRSGVTAITVWMCAAFLAFISYMFMSGGGV